MSFEVGGAGTEDDEPPGPRTTWFEGNGQFVGSSPAGPATVHQTDDGFALNFVDADIRTVLSAILGDILGLPWLVDAPLEGSLTLQSSAEVPREALLPALEAALRVRNLALLETDGLYQVLPVAQVPQRGITAVARPDGVRRPGFGVQIVPLRHVGALEMSELLRPFAPSNAILRVDEPRRLVVLAGTGGEMRAMLDTVRTFDVDWMAGMSSAIYKVHYVEAEQLAKELTAILSDPASPAAGSIRLIPIPRLNAILGISADISNLRRVEQWVERLDLRGSSEGRRIYVYRVQNGDAADIAASLGAITGTSAPPPAVPSAGRSPTAAASARTTPQAASTDQNAPAAPQAESPVFGENGLRIVPNAENNSLLILATPGEFGVLEAALRQIDIPPRQVLIEASIAEVTLNNDLRYGVQWFFENGDVAFTFSQASSGGIGSQFPGFSFLFEGSDAATVLNALESVTDVQVLSSPKLLVLNNRSATLQVGDQVPIITRQAVGVVDSSSPVVNSVDLRDTGVILTVRPRINDSGMILLEIEQEVSDVAPTTTSGIDSPTIQQRLLTSSVAIRNGETLALGGLIRENATRSRSGIPFLSRIPLIGPLFGTNDFTNRRTELVILLTPRVIRDSEETEEVMEYLRRQFRTVAPMVPVPQAEAEG